MQVREVSELDWSSEVAKLSYATMFLSWEWGVFERELGNEFLNLGIYEDNIVVGLLPIKVIKAKRGKYLHLRHGPVIDWGNSGLVEFTMGFLKNLALEKEVDFVRISPLIKKNTFDLKRHGLAESFVHNMDAELTVVLDLTQSENAILMQMRKNTRNLIRKAEKIGVEVKIVNDKFLLDDFFKLYLQTVERHKWYAYSTDYIKQEFEIFSEAKKAWLAVAYFEGEPISASIFLTQNSQVIYHHSGSSSRHSNLPSAYLLHWEVIKFFKERGMKLYNFWGVSPESDKKSAWYGLSLFKRGFTKQELEFVHPHDLIVKPMAHVTRLYELLESKNVINLRESKPLKSN